MSGISDAILQVAKSIQSPGVSSIPKIQAPVGNNFSQGLNNIIQAMGNPAIQPGTPSYLQSFINSGSNGTTIDPKVQQASNLNNAYLRQFINLGGKSTGKRPSIIHRVFDILSRPEYGLFDATLQGLKAGRESRGVGNIIEKSAGGLVHGLAGTHKTLSENIAQYGQDVNYAKQLPGSHQANIRSIKTGESGPIPRAAQLLALLPDIFLDPLNAISGAGAIEGLTKTAKLLGKADEIGQGTKDASKLALSSGIDKTGQLSNLVRPATKIPSITQQVSTTKSVQGILDKLLPVLQNQHLESATREAQLAGKVPVEVPKLKIINKSTTRSPDVATAQKIHEINAPTLDVAHNEKMVAQNSSKLNLPREKNGMPYVSHMGTLDNYLKRVKPKDREFTSEELKQHTDNWWHQAAIDHTRIMRAALDPTWAFKSSAEWQKAAKAYGNKMYSDLPEVNQYAKTGRVMHFSDNEFKAIKALKGKLTHQIDPESLLARDSAKAKNDRLAADIHGQATMESQTAYKNMQHSVLEDLARANTPETIKRLGVTLKGFGHTANLHLTPEIISRQLQHITKAPVVNSSLKALEKAFVSTGHMSPEMQALAGTSRGMQVGPHAAMIHAMGDAFKGHKEEEIGKSLNHVITNSSELGSNSEVESAIHNHLGGIVDQLRDGIARKHGVTLGTYNAYLPEGMKLNLKNRPEVSKAILGPDREHAISTFKEELQNGLLKGKAQRPLDYLGHLGNAAIKTRANKAIRAEMTRFGVPLRQGGKISETAQHLKDTAGYRELKYGNSPDYVYHPNVANDADRMFELLGSHKAQEDLTKLIQKPLTIWKKMATIYNLPGYPTRNFIANTYMNSLVGGMHGAEAAKSYKIGAKVMRNRLEKSLQGDMDPVKIQLAKQLDNEIPAHGVAFVKHGVNDLPNGQFTPELVDAMYRRAGLESTFTGANFADHPNLSTGIRGVLHNVNEKITNSNKAVEDYSRMSLYAHWLRLGTGKTLQELSDFAANKVRKALFDYNDVTPFERKAMVNAFPFYKWNRKAIPALFQGLLDHPGKVLNVQNAIRGGLQTAGGTQPDLKDPWGLSNAEPLNRVPAWIQNRMSVPFGKTGKNGSQSYLDPSTPINDEMRLIGDPSAIISQINPLYRVPVEETLGKQFFHNLPIKNKVEYATVDQINVLRTLLKAAGNSAAPVGTTGQGGDATSTGSNPLSSLLSTLNPVRSVSGPQQNTPKSQYSTLLSHNTKLQKEIKALIAQRAKS